MEFKSCVIERLMGIDSFSTQQPIEKCSVLSEDYLRKMCSVGMRRKQQFNENRLSWMETDGPVFDESVDVSICSSVEHSFGTSHPRPRHIDFSESLNSIDSKGNGNRCTHECELKGIPYFSGSSGVNICPSPAENGTLKQYVTKGQLDSFRLIQSLQDYLSGNTWKPCTDDKKGKSSTMNCTQSSKFRQRIYMDPEKEVAAHTRYIKEKMNLANSKLEDFTITPLRFQSRIDHNTPSSNFNDPCLRAMRALKESGRTSKVSKNYLMDSVTMRTCTNSSRESRHISCPDPSLARKNSTIIKSLKDNSQDLVLLRSFSSKRVRQKTCSDIALSVSTLAHPENGLSDNIDRINSDVIDDNENHQDSMDVLPGVVSDNLFSPEPLSPRSSEEACQHSPVSVLRSSSNAGLVSDSDHFKHVSAELRELRMQLQLLHTEFPEGFSESSETVFSKDEDNEEQVWAPLCNLNHEAREIKCSPRKELVRDSWWLEFGEEIHAIGTELESLLIVELIEDFIYT